MGIFNVAKEAFKSLVGGVSRKLGRNKEEDVAFYNMLNRADEVAKWESAAEVKKTEKQEETDIPPVLRPEIRKNPYHTGFRLKVSKRDNKDCMMGVEDNGWVL